MRPQYYSWLFDDRNAWEKSLADPRYSYELPIDSFMSLYCSEREQYSDSMQFSAISAMPAAMPMVSDAAMSAAIFNTPLDNISVIAPGGSKEEKQEEGILSQDDIDALLSGL